MSIRVFESILIPALFFFLTFQTQQTFAQTKRALLIGINTYEPPESFKKGKTESSRTVWSNLEGCINDVNAIREVLIARFGFSMDDIDTLYNAQASREQIIGNLKRLVNDSHKGDVVFIYYSGHGSQVRNSLSPYELDKKDETIVPADSYMGVKDIRDKELAALFNLLLDKGVILTVIFDSCHSGSLGKGSPTGKMPKARFLQVDTIDVKDPTKVTDPASRGALILSGSQDFENALELPDETHHSYHGVFTSALLDVLNTMPISAPVKDLFIRTRSIMKSKGVTQEPVIAASDERKSQNLLGTDVSDLSGKASVAALYAGSSFIILQGGYALGLDSGSLLRRIDDTLTVRVFKMNGLNRCIAKIERGDLSTVSVGDLFEIINWVSPKGSSLKVYLPSSDLDATAITQIVSQFNQLMQDDRFAWVRDPSEETPEYIIFYDKENWVISTPDGQLLLINGDVTAEYLRNNVQGGAKIFAYLPPSKSFYNELISKISKSNSVELTDDPNLARYHLVGTAEDGQARYAFYWPKVSREDGLYLSTMPLRTDFVNVNNENSAVATNTLVDYAEKIAKIKVWLNMHNPIDEGRFPFHLVLKNHKTEAYYHLGDTVYGDDLLVLALETDKENLESWDQKSRYIYVISIYNDGSIKVRFPESSENVGNKLPIMQNGEVEDITILSKKKGLRVGEPYGIDTYVMLTTDEPITFFEMMNSDAVYQNTKGEANYQELMYILNGNTKTRSVFTPANWSVYHLQVKTMGD